LTVLGDRQRGGGIESAGQQYDGFGSGLNGLCLHRFIVLARLPRAVYAVESAYVRAVGRAKSSLPAWLDRVGHARAIAAPGCVYRGCVRGLSGMPIDSLLNHTARI